MQKCVRRHMKKKVLIWKYNENRQKEIGFGSMELELDTSSKQNSMC